MKIGIVGAGIAGLTAAYFAKKNGWDVELIEQSVGERTTGYMMDFFGNGWQVAQRMEIVDDMRACTYPLESLGYVDSRGALQFQVPIERFRGAFGGHYTYIRRQDLEHILLEQVRRAGIPVLYGHTVESLTQTDTSVRVLLNGQQTEREYDLLIGADGAHSHVRRLVFGDESQFAHYLGYAVCAFETELDAQLTQRAFHLYQEPGLQCGCYPVSDYCMDVMYMIPAPKKHLHNHEIKSLLRQQVAGAGWVAESLLAKTPDEKITYVDVLEQIRMPAWHSDRVVLVGDANACLTPIAGQGASMAMFESFTFIHALSQYSTDPKRACEAYESLLSADILKRQKDAESFASSFLPTTRFGVLKQQILMRLALSQPFIGYTARSFTGHLFAI